MNAQDPKPTNQKTKNQKPKTRNQQPETRNQKPETRNQQQEPEPEGPWDSGHRSLTLGLVLTVSAAAFEAMAVATILPATVSEIGGLNLYGWVFSAFMLANLLGITMGGDSADRSGVWRPFILGSSLFVAGLVAAGAAPSMTLLISARILQGLGAGGISAAAYVAVARAYPPAIRPRMLALLSTAWVVPGLIGPALAGAIADYLSWRWVFLGLAPFVAMVSILAVPSLRRLPAPDSPAAWESHRTLTSLRLALGTGLALYGLGDGRVLAAVPLVAVGVVFAVPAFGNLTPPGTLLARPGLPAAIATMGLLSAAFFGAEAFVPLSLTSIRGQSTTMAGIALSAATLSWTVGAWIQARLAPNRDHRALILAGLAVMMVGIIGTAAILSPAVPVSLAVLTWGISGLGIGVAYSTTTLVILESAPAGQEGNASAALQLSSVLGIALGTGLGGAVLAFATSSEESPLLGIGLADLIAISAVASSLLAARRVRQGRGARAERL